jgi:ribosomal protein S18 acetylase RimI-like enzyme
MYTAMFLAVFIIYFSPHTARPKQNVLGIVSVLPLMLYNVAMNISLRLLEKRDIPVIYTSFIKSGWFRPPMLLENYLLEQRQEHRTIFVAYLGEEFAGYVTIAWKSDYPPFVEKGIPEIVDINCLLPFQRRGIATALMDKAEGLVLSARRPLVLA